MVYEIPTSKASQTEHQFHFQIPGSDTVHTVPLLKYLPIGVAAKLESADSLTETLLIFGDAAEAVGGLDSEQFEGLLDAWRAASGITEGESQASSDS